MDAQDQFPRAEGLGDVIIRAQFEADDPVHFLGFGGEHDDRNLGRRGLLFQHLAHFEAAHPGQHQIENDEGRRIFPGLLQRRRSVLGLEHREAGALEIAS